MPIYEFYSPQARKIYSFYARSLAYSSKVPRCPDDPSYTMEKMLSSFATPNTKRAEPAQAPAGGMPGLDDAKMEGVMAQMEREFSGMDENNPDPRALARMMKTVAEATGEKMPREMQEMMARMEKGEDPEKLEAEYGDALDGFGEPSGDGAEAGDEKAGRRGQKKRIDRDPTLYEMADFVD
jgi:hypothetical protein